MRALVTRLDSFGDVLLAGPAVRAAAARAAHVTFLCGPRGAAAARLLPGVDEVLVWEAPWAGPQPVPVEPDDVAAIVADLRARRPDTALVLASAHQSPLPTALVLRLAGVRRVAADSVHYPGGLLDVRHQRHPSHHEARAALALAEAAGFALPPGDDGRLAVLPPTAAVREGAARLTAPAGPGYVVVHPGASAPARCWQAGRLAETVRLLAADGHGVVVTGGAGERELTAAVAGRDGLDLGGATDAAGLAAVLAGAGAVVVGNTGPAHLAAAVGTPVVSLFSPVVPAERWGPYRVPHVLLGDQRAVCAGTRARECPVAGHPCLGEVTAADAVAAVEKLLKEDTA
ncbi:glycosyltransferase family 9 protein [Streptomyces sp. TRM 70351]|uniref:glycosyltransferase family 9 protein n=1 Tax=Streptomyces sp. TRM 70351 TaxID=3116552 RepID=UPI002E7B2891|nr:glycosyltransferase family 9 protein [Streptomyces sp. TRM 70351]MEE1927021.1 glycosyltransferase family 9 protein [Streptomyces sp. TRM 70351]